jgi:hypothetical protein
MNLPSRIIFGLLLAGLCLAGTGCGGGSNISSISGKIVKDGQPFKLSEKGVFTITFLPDGGGNGFGPDWKPDGTFVLYGPERKGVPPGKYKVAVEAYDPYPGPDLLKGEFKQAKTPIVKELSGNTPIEIDVSKK